MDRSLLLRVAAHGLGDSTPLAPEPLDPASWSHLVDGARAQRIEAFLMGAINVGRLPVTDDQRADALTLQRNAVLGVLRLEHSLLATSRTFEERGIELRVRMSIGSTEALKRLVQDGRGIAWLSPHMVREELASGRLASLEVRDLTIEREFHALWRPGQSLSPAPAAFLELARKPG